jgi:hypothetical protein
MLSETYWVLLVAGLAFLISGHRGAGKTTLVQPVVDDLGDELFRYYLTQTEPTLGQQTFLFRVPQRPLLVKLHGPSLLTDELPRPGGGEKPSQDAPAKTANNAEEEEPKALARSTRNTGTAHGALVQITIALYRALTREFAEAYAIRARAAYRLQVDDQLDIGAQFRLDLDRAPDAARLRAYWERLADASAGPDTGAIAGGIIWPQEIGAYFHAAGLPDQSTREMVALATATQAFQVCSGVVEYRETKKTWRLRADDRGQGRRRCQGGGQSSDWPYDRRVS